MGLGLRGRVQSVLLRADNSIRTDFDVSLTSICRNVKMGGSFGSRFPWKALFMREPGSGAWHFPARTSGSTPYRISCILLHRALYETAWFGGCLDVQLRSRAQALRRHPRGEGSREGSRAHFPPASGHKRRSGRNPNQNGLPHQEVREGPQRLAGWGLGHNLCHVYSTSSHQVRHLRQTDHPGTGKGERGGEACA